MKVHYFFLLCNNMLLVSNLYNMHSVAKVRFDDKHIISHLFQHFSLEESLHTVSALTGVNKQYNHDFNNPGFTRTFMRFLSGTYGEFGNYEDDMIKKLRTKGACNYYEYSKRLVNVKHDAEKAVLRWIKLGGDARYRVSKFVMGDSRQYESPFSNAVARDLTKVAMVLFNNGADYYHDEPKLLPIAVKYKNSEIAHALLSQDSLVNCAIKLEVILNDWKKAWHYCANNAYINIRDVFDKAIKIREKYRHPFIFMILERDTYFIKEVVENKAQYIYWWQDALKIYALTEIIQKLLHCGVAITVKDIKKAHRRADKELLNLYEQSDQCKNMDDIESYFMMSFVQ